MRMHGRRSEKLGKPMSARSRPGPKPAAHPCSACRFGADSIWQPVVDAQRGVLARSLQRRPLSADETLFVQGGPADAIYCLSAGLIALRSYRPDGGSALVRLVYPGEILGFRSFLARDPHQTEARALVPSRVCRVATREAQQIVAASPETLGRIARRCAEELGRLRNWQSAAVKKGNRYRLARLIVQLIEGAEPEAGGRLRLPLSRQDMAAALGIEAETVTRLIGRLRDEGVLAISGRWVEPDSIERLAGVT